MAKRKATEQNHLLVAFPSITDRDPRKYQMQLLFLHPGAACPPGCSSRCGRKNGLCYSVYTFGTSHEEVGLFSVYTALNQEQEPRAIACIRDVLTGIFCRTAPTQQELELARGAEQGQKRLNGAGGHLRPDEPSGPVCLLRRGSS